MTSAPANGRARVLVIDDELDMLEILRDLFEGEGYTVAIADSGAQAIELYRHAPFDIVITDLRMAGLDGVQTIRELRRLDPHLPVIVASAYASDETERRCRDVGALECLQKPVDLESLLRMVGAAVQAR